MDNYWKKTHFVDKAKDYNLIEKTVDKPTVTLHNWEVVSQGSQPYTAPEFRATTLRGEVIGHHVFDDGTIVVTSTPIASEDRCVETANTVYVLGQPSAAYVLWCDEHGISIDDDKPYKVR